MQDHWIWRRGLCRTMQGWVLWSTISRIGLPRSVSDTFTCTNIIRKTFRKFRLESELKRRKSASFFTTIGIYQRSNFQRPSGKCGDKTMLLLPKLHQIQSETRYLRNYYCIIRWIYDKILIEKIYIVSCSCRAVFNRINRWPCTYSEQLNRTCPNV
jgi:hypothetical protein